MNSWFDLRPPGGGIAFLAALCILAGAFFAITGGDSWYTRFVCPLFLPLGIGLWLKYSWARWIAFIVFVLLSAISLLMLMNVGISVKSVLRSVMVLATVYSLWEWDVYPSPNDDPVLADFGHIDGEPNVRPETSKDPFVDA